METWRDIKGYEGLYQVSDEGRVRSFFERGSHRVVKEPRVLSTPVSNPIGYRICVLYKNGRRTQKLVHRLVAEAFVPNPENKPQVNHMNGNRVDNRSVNLEWVTCRENVLHGFRHNGRVSPAKGRHIPCPYRPFTPDQIRFIRESELSGVELSKKFGVTPQAICGIRKRKTYRDVE